MNASVTVQEEQSNQRIQRLLSEKEAAEAMNVSRATLAGWRATKKYPLKFIVCGGSIRYRCSDIEEFLNARTVHEDGKTPPGVVRHPSGPGRPPKSRRESPPPNFLLPKQSKRVRRS